MFFDDSGANFSSGFDFLAVLQAVSDDCLSTIGVGDDLLGWEGGGVFIVFVFGPVDRLGGSPRIRVSCYREKFVYPRRRG